MSSRQRKYQKEMAAQNRCMICGQAEFVKGYCERHYRARMDRIRRARGEPKQEQSCTICGDPGHNRRSCKNKEEVEDTEAEA